MRRRRRFWAMVAMLVLSMAAAGCGDDDGPSEAFRFGADNLCEWVSEAEVAEFVAAEFDWDGSAVEVGPGRGGCEWELTGGEGGIVVAEDSEVWRDFDGNPVNLNDDFLAQGETEYQDGHVGIGDFVTGHSAVSDGVVVFNGGFGQFAFGAPSSSEWLVLSVHVPGEDDWNDDYEHRFFAVADRFLEQLGWLSQP